MSNIVEPNGRQALVMEHATRAITHYVRRLNRALYRMQNEVLCDIAIDEQLNGEHYDAARSIIKQFVADRVLASETMTQIAMRELRAEFCRRLPGPQDAARQRKRWSPT